MSLSTSQSPWPLAAFATSLPGDFAAVLADIAALGFTHVDLVAEIDRPPHPVEAIADSGLLVSCLAVGRNLPVGHTLDAMDAGVRRAALALLQRQVADAACLGATTVYLVPPLTPNPSPPRGEGRKNPARRSCWRVLADDEGCPERTESLDIAGFAFQRRAVPQCRLGRRHLAQGHTRIGRQRELDAIEVFLVVVGLAEGVTVGLSGRRFPGSGESEIAAQMVRDTAVDLAAAVERQLCAVELGNQVMAKDRRRVFEEHARDRPRVVDASQLFLAQILDGPILVDFELILHYHG